MDDLRERVMQSLSTMFMILVIFFWLYLMGTGLIFFYDMMSSAIQ